jgi:hypothetical protein
MSSMKLILAIKTEFVWHIGFSLKKLQHPINIKFNKYKMRKKINTTKCSSKKVKVEKNRKKMACSKAGRKAAVIF